jgi:hypothetical protein
VGECYVGFSKLLQSELKKFEKRDSNILSNRMSRMSNRVSTMVSGTGNNSIRTKNEGGGLGLAQGHISTNPFMTPQQHSTTEKKSFEENLWHMGKVLGTVRGEFTLANMPIMQQMALGVLTENGISMNVSPISEDNHQLLLNGLQQKGKKQNEKIT